MTAIQVLMLVGGYFALLILISWLTGKKSDNQTFFSGNRSSRWYVVAFGMIGASLSGVTFISVPGWVGTNGFAYMQMVLGYIVGYAIIIYFLLPLYYKLNLISIYQYLEQRFGFWSYKTGALFFLISRVMGASFRLFLVAEVFQFAISKPLGIPYWATVWITIMLIWVYTFRSGIKTIVWTDTLQTFCMLAAVGVTIYLIREDLGWSTGEMITEISNSKYSRIFFWDWGKGSHFVKQFLSGALIAVVMTGLDQDMMQKNLTCRNLKDAQKNIWGLSISLVFVNLFFLALGALLFIYADLKNVVVPKGDALFTTIAMEHLSPVVALFFVLGVIAAAYSSADSALTSLTTSFCVDFLELNKPPKEGKERALDDRFVRIVVHYGFSLLLFVFIMIFSLGNDKSIIAKLFKAATYTYGPLLGMFAFGILTKRKLHKGWGILYVSISAPVICYFFDYFLTSNEYFEMGNLTLLLNGLLTFGGMWLMSEKSDSATSLSSKRA